METNKKFKHQTLWESGWISGYSVSIIKLVNPFSGEQTGFQAGYISNVHGNANVEFFSTMKEAIDHLYSIFAKLDILRKVDTKSLTRMQLQNDEIFKTEMISMVGEELVLSFLAQ